jgi:iron complex transport system ATP-binding protein
VREPPLLEACNVTVLRGGREVLRDLTLRIDTGEHIAILGPNGCGKSTLLKTLTRECYPVVRDGSYLRLFGRDRWNIFALRASLGIVTADLAVACALEISACDLVVSGFFSSTGPAPHHDVLPAMRTRARRALERVGAVSLAERTMTTLSAGEARRVLIARALVHAPRALVFDEPSTSLDLAAQRDLRAELRRLARDGIGIVLVTHHLPDVIPEIERVAFMSGGRIVADGTRAELLTADRLAALFGVPIATLTGSALASERLSLPSL